jgi:DnaK suppressor protein
MGLTREQLTQIEVALLARRQTLNAEIDHRIQQTSARGMQELTGTVGDAADESVAHMMTALDLSEATRDVNELRDVDAALRRIENGTYGDCLDCGASIEYARLKAYPIAARCVECQSQYEKVYASQSTPSL